MRLRCWTNLVSISALWAIQSLVQFASAISLKGVGITARVVSPQVNYVTPVSCPLSLTLDGAAAAYVRIMG